MKNKKYSWNETLKFSWGHIITFIAIVFISYIAFMGEFYSNGGSLEDASLKILLIDLALLCSFLGAQVLKSSDKHFNRSIKFERIFIVLSLASFIWAMIPYNHFWNVYGDRDQIESRFNVAINKSKIMFDEYEEYARNRINRYENNLRHLQKIDREAYVQALSLQLLSENTSNLKNKAIKWINDSNIEVSVWNAFLVGNIKEVSNGILEWSDILSDFSRPVLSNEIYVSNNITPFDSNKQIENLVRSNFDNLNNIYKIKRGVAPHSIWTGIFLILLLFFPYFLQKRNTRAEGFYSLLPFNSKKTIKECSQPLNSQNNTNLESDNKPFTGKF